jgi:DNA repair ATPase RecN
MNALAIAAEVEDIEQRLQRLSPQSHNPHKYHEDKSELRKDLRAIAEWLRTGRKPD